MIVEVPDIPPTCHKTAVMKLNWPLSINYKYMWLFRALMCLLVKNEKIYTSKLIDTCSHTHTLFTTDAVQQLIMIEEINLAWFLNVLKVGYLYLTNTKRLEEIMLKLGFSCVT